MVLICGHEPSPHSEHTTGTAHTDRGEICWDCALTEERAALLTCLHSFAYLSEDGQHITAWPGGILMTVTKEWTRNVGFGFKTTRTYLQATDIHGAHHWYGTSPGRGMYARMHRSA